MQEDFLTPAAERDQQLDTGDKWEALALATVEHAEDLGRAGLAFAFEQGHGLRIEFAPRLVHRAQGDDCILEFVIGFALDGNTIRAVGTAPQHWMDRARNYIAAMPVGSPPVDMAAIKDIQDPNFVRLRDEIQARVITFDTNEPKPANGQDEAIDKVATELSELIRVAKDLGFSVRVMIVGHADATGRETVNLALSNARAEVVRSMLRARGIAPYLLLVRSAGALEPQQSAAAGQPEAMNRRVTFTVSTSD